MITFKFHSCYFLLAISWDCSLCACTCGFLSPSLHFLSVLTLITVLLTNGVDSLIPFCFVVRMYFFFTLNKHPGKMNLNPVQFSVLNRECSDIYRLVTWLHLQMQQHDVNPKVRLLAGQEETGFGVQAVEALQGTGERELGHAASIRICYKKTPNVNNKF